MTTIVTIPLFRLPVAALPGEIVPLHIFEPRYRRMVEFCMERSTEAASCPFGISYSANMHRARVGTIMQINSILQEHENGRQDILTVGTRRFELIEELPTKAFPTARVKIIEDRPVVIDAETVEICIDSFIRLLQLLEHEEVNRQQIPRNSFQLAVFSQFDSNERLALLESGDENERLLLVNGLLQYRIELVSQQGPEALLFGEMMQ